MSNRQRGGKTLSAEDEITADSVNLVGTGLSFNGNFGTANQVVQVDTGGTQRFKDITLGTDSVSTDNIEDNAINGDKLADDIVILSSGYAQFTGAAVGTGLSITNDIDCASTIKTDNLDNRTGNDISVKGNIDLGTNTLKTNTISNSQAGGIDINSQVSLTTNNIDTTSGNIGTTTGAISTTSGQISSDTGNIFTNSGNISTGGTLETNTIDGFVVGSITVNRNLSLTTNNLDTTSGNIQTSSGAIGTTTGQIASDSGAIFTNSGNISTGGTLEADTIDSYSGGEIIVNQNLELTTNQLGTTSGAITSATGNIGTTSGNIETTNGNMTCGGTLSTDTIASVSGGAISINSNVSLPTTAQFDTASGNIQSNSGDISTVSGDLVASSGNCIVGGSVQTDTIESRTGGATQIGINSDMAFDTNKSLFFVGTGGIGGGTSSNIQFNTGTFREIQGNSQETIQFSRTSINLRAQSGTGGDITADGGTIIFRNLPTSATGLASGQLYNDSGTLKIV